MICRFAFFTYTILQRDLSIIKNKLSSRGRPHTHFMYRFSSSEMPFVLFKDKGCKIFFILTGAGVNVGYIRVLSIGNPHLCAIYKIVVTIELCLGLNANSI